MWGDWVAGGEIWGDGAAEGKVWWDEAVEGWRGGIGQQEVLGHQTPERQYGVMGKL